MGFTIKHTKTAKGAAILMLLYFHIFVGYYDYHYDLSLIAHSCVWLFVFLSGFGLTASYSKITSSVKKTFTWIIRRIWNIETFFWPHFLIGIAVLYLFLHRTIMSQYGAIWRVVLDFFCVSDLFGQTHVFGVWWYMGLSLLIILAVPLLVMITDKIGYFIIPLVYALILLIPDLIVKDGNIGPYQGYYLAAVLGVVASRKNLLNKYVDYIEHAPRFYLIAINALLIITGSALGLFLSGINNEMMSFFLIPQLIKTIIAVLVILICVSLYKVRFVSTALQFMGDLSDDMFIIHIVINTVLERIVYYIDTPLTNYVTLLALSIPATLALKAIKKLAGYDKLVKFIGSKIES
jgi:peptidoglycan/LPS O-acetylase OafA/YrhL